MNKRNPAPPPVTITIGGRNYTGTHPEPEIWREFQKHASLAADPLEQLMATATLLHAIIGTDAKNEIADRVAAGEIKIVDVINAVSDAAGQWRDHAARDHP